MQVLVSPKRPAFTGGGSPGSGTDNAQHCSVNDEGPLRFDILQECYWHIPSLMG